MDEEYDSLDAIQQHNSEVRSHIIVCQSKRSRPDPPIHPTVRGWTELRIRNSHAIKWETHSQKKSCCTDLWKLYILPIEHICWVVPVCRVNEKITATSILIEFVVTFDAGSTERWTSAVKSLLEES